ncbi:MAG: DNA polymerase III subunit gamma/tau [Patescibacteria group bacterium]
MTVLYQKYRPKKFSEVFGQNNIKTTLQNEITHNRTSHAYLFCGPRAVGKTTLARILAKAINCQDRKKDDPEPCNKCESCLSIDEFRNLDVMEIDAASNTGVDNVRENIISISKIATPEKKYKVFIIDEVHMLSISAFNALLKTLEEPPSRVIFVLCTTEVHKLPLTIVSRCQRFDFKKISTNDMISKLETIIKSEKIEVDRDVLDLIALKSDGHLRDAESLLNQIISISDKKIDYKIASLVIPNSNMEDNIDFLKILAKKDSSSAIELINNIIDNGANLKLFVSDLIELIRKIILNKNNPSLSSKLGLDLSDKMEKRINDLTDSFDMAELISLTEDLLENLKNVDSSFIPQMPLEFSIIRFCGFKNKIEREVLPVEKKIEESITKTEETKEEKQEKIKEGLIKIDEFLNLWPEFLMKLKSHNHSLSFVMQSCKVDSLTGNKVCLIFKYKLHKDRLENPEMKKIIKQLLKEVYSHELDIEAIIDNNLKTSNNSNDNNMIDDLLKTFGGQLIN